MSIFLNFAKIHFFVNPQLSLYCSDFSLNYCLETLTKIANIYQILILQNNLQVKEGWSPLCKFLDLPIPSIPFPNENDTNQIEQARKQLVQSSWLTVVFLPLLALTGVLVLDSYPALGALGLVGCAVCYMSGDVHHLKQKQS